MRPRPIVVFATIAAVMVCWLMVRMWCGGLPAVWAVSCVFGAWAPIMAAAMFAYVRAVGDGEHSVAVAWLVRAIGMHILLVWMLGTSDWLRNVSAWNSDVGAPLVLIMFAPAFALGISVVQWLMSVARRLNGTVLRPAMPGEGLSGTVPFRGVSLVAVGAPASRFALAPVILAIGACLLACTLHAMPWWLLGACAWLLALLTSRNHRALIPSVAVLAGLTGVVLSRAGTVELRSIVGLAMAWPWLALASVGFYLTALEALVRSRRMLES